MNYGKLFLVLCACVCVSNGDRVEDTQIHLELLEMDYEDWFDKLADSERNILLNKTDAFRERLETQSEFNNFVRSEAEVLHTTYNLDGFRSPLKTKRIMNLLYSAGDYKLPQEYWHKLTKFQKDNEETLNKMNLACSLKRKGCTEEDISNILSTSRNYNELQKIWSTKQELFLSHGAEYPSVLELVKVAAKENGHDNFMTYWENLIEYPDAYTKAKNLWEEIEPLYTKLHNFVKLRLQKKYQKNFDSVPAYLLGSEFGEDWSNIADIVLPHRYLYDEIVTSLNHEKIGGQKLYESTRKLMNALSLDNVGEDFWKKSVFNNTCPSHLLIHPSDKYSQVITCNKTGWTEYLDAHEDMMRAGFIHRDYSKYVDGALRISALDESLAGLSTLLALKNLPITGIVPIEAILNDKNNEIQASALLLTALRILPRLPYYLLADIWRLEQLERESQDMVLSWWEHREFYQKVKGVKNNEWDLLGDNYITLNKPYIGKFLGTIMQFQLLEYFETRGDNDVNILTRIATDEQFKALLNEKDEKSWLELVNFHFNIYEINVEPLLKYFKPLEEYIDRAPMKQVTRKVIPRTTTPKPTTTIPTTTTETKFVKDQPVSETVKNAEEKIINAKPEEKVVETKTEIKTEEDKEVVSQESTGSKAAVWVGVALGLLMLSVMVGVLVKKKFSRPNRNNRSFTIIYDQELIELD